MDRFIMNTRTKKFQLHNSGDFVRYSEIGALQAKIDELMLEYCPDDMTDDQLEAWAEAQVIMEKDDE